MDIVAVNNAREINFVQTDTNYVFSGTFKKQFNSAFIGFLSSFGSARGQ
jgi:hypothetical protein